MRTLPLLLALCALPALAQEDVFGFMPDGGRTLAESLISAHPEALAALATARPAGDWKAQIAQGALSGAEAFDDWQQQTLADYLAYAGPVTEAGALPQDGRDMALAKCQSCHIITVVVTQARTRDAWLGTMHKPSHIGVPLTEEQRGQLADYLVVNAGIPIDDIPPELRAGGASY